MIHSSKKIILMTVLAAQFAACKKDTDPVIIVKPSNGAQIQFNGLAGAEPGSAAGNLVFLDFSSNKTTTVARASWDLGFYCGSDFRVILNNTTGAGAKVLAKNDLTTVTFADTTGLTLAVNQFNPQPSELAYFDDIAGSISATAIPAVSATAALNNVVIVNRGTAGSIAPRPWIKLRVLRNTSGGYTLQYAGITETTFRTLQVPKDGAWHFTFVSFDNGLVEVQPEKEKWDLVWSYSVFQTNFGAGLVPYNFSDLIAVNHLSGVQVKENIYADAAIATAAYTAFNRDSVNNTTLATGRWTMGSNWRSASPTPGLSGVKKDRFYIIKDPAGNVYKLKCLSFHADDGGTRGKPEFKYELIQ
ncbi:MAG: HmuY family protein [Ferruginibacter sp.]|nr:HmuY family protein [Chitinophagaceae bacterium]